METNKWELAAALAYLDVASCTADPADECFDLEAAREGISAAQEALQSIFSAVGGTEEDMRTTRRELAEETANEVRTILLPHSQPAGSV